MQHDYKPFPGEVNDPKKFGHYVETIGYVPIARQVDSFFRAGQRTLDDNSNYDSLADDPDDFDDPSYKVREMELSEIGQAMSGLAGKLTDSARAAAEAQAAAEAGKIDVEGSDPKTDSES